MITPLHTLADDELLTDSDPLAFGEFYARHLPGIERYCLSRLGDREAAADLAAETFAAALVARRRFRSDGTPAAAWLYTIARRRIIDLQRRRAAEARSRARLAGERPPAQEAEDTEPGLLRHLSPEQRAAIAGHVLQGHGYRELAVRTGSSEASLRQRVSRGLGALRAPLRLYRAAQSVAREDRVYRFGAGHCLELRAIAPRDALDCSAAASLVLARGGVLPSVRAWTSTRLAEEWGEPRRGTARHVVGHPGSRVAGVQARHRPRRALRPDAGAARAGRHLAERPARPAARLRAAPLARALTRWANTRCCAPPGATSSWRAPSCTTRSPSGATTRSRWPARC